VVCTSGPDKSESRTKNLLDEHENSNKENPRNREPRCIHIREVLIGVTQKDKNSLQGNIAELGNNLYQYGTQDQGDRLTRTIEAIADYVGREYSKEMRLLMKNQKANEPKELVMPDKKEEANSPFVMKKSETELKQYYFKKERYQEHKAKIFVIVKGQCTLNMKNKGEILKGYDLIEANDDVIK
jgi:hypothetical protein